MADLSDVENALVAVIAAVIYPDGIDGASAVGAPCKVYRGWPNEAALFADLAAGAVNVTVYPRSGMTKNTTRYPLTWETIATAAPTITVSNTVSTVTFAGVPGIGNLCGIRAGGLAYAYAAAPADTPGAVAAALGAQIPGATVNGATVTINGVPDLLGRTVGTGTIMQETRRQVQGFLIIVWAPTPALRDTITAVVDAALAPVEFLTLADGTGGRLLYRNTILNDAPSKDTLWRRDLVYEVEYPTTLTVKNVATLLFGLGSQTITTSIKQGETVDVSAVQWEPQ